MQDISRLGIVVPSVTVNHQQHIRSRLSGIQNIERFVELVETEKTTLAIELNERTTIVCSGRAPGLNVGAIPWWLAISGGYLASWYIPGGTVSHQNQ